MLRTVFKEQLVSRSNHESSKRFLETAGGMRQFGVRPLAPYNYTFFNIRSFVA